MNEKLIKIGIPSLVFGLVLFIIGIALWIGLKKPKPRPTPKEWQSDYCIICEAEQVLSQYQQRLRMRGES